MFLCNHCHKTARVQYIRPLSRRPYTEEELKNMFKGVGEKADKADVQEDKGAGYYDWYDCPNCGTGIFIDLNGMIEFHPGFYENLTDYFLKLEDRIKALEERMRS